MQILKDFFRNRAKGFYVSAVAAGLTLVVAIVYAIGYGDNPKYMSWTAFALCLVAFVAFAALCIFKPTERLAPLALGALDFVAFLLYVHAIYLYLSEVFFDGFKMESFARMNPAFIICTLGLLASVVLSNVAIYLKQSKEIHAEGQAE